VRVSIVRPHEARDPADVCVVIDVVRATTTATVLCHRLGGLCAVRGPDEVALLPPRDDGYVVFSELSTIQPDVMRYDNSPVLAKNAELGRRMPVLVTTNGTRALAVAATLAPELVLASFINLASVVEHVRAHGAHTVAIMPAGNIKNAQVCAEDDGCANVLAALLANETIDTAHVLTRCRTDERITRRLAREPDLAADLDVCFASDTVPVVPRVTHCERDHTFSIASAR